MVGWEIADDFLSPSGPARALGLDDLGLASEAYEIALAEAGKPIPDPFRELLARFIIERALECARNADRLRADALEYVTRFAEERSKAQAHHDGTPAPHLLHTQPGRHGDPSSLLWSRHNRVSRLLQVHSQPRQHHFIAVNTPFVVVRPPAVTSPRLGPLPMCGSARSASPATGTGSCSGCLLGRRAIMRSHRQNRGGDAPLLMRTAGWQSQRNPGCQLSVLLVDFHSVVRDRRAWRPASGRRKPRSVVEPGRGFLHPGPPRRFLPNPQTGTAGITGTRR